MIQRHAEVQGLVRAPGVVELAVGIHLGLQLERVADHFAAGSRAEADVALTSRSVYDDLGREMLTTSPRGIRTSSAVDRLGRVSAVTANLRDGAPAAASTDDDDLRATYAYNVVGELLASCTPEAVYGADGCDPLATSGAPFQSAWHYAYDAMGRLIAEVRPVNRSLTPALDSRGWVYGSAGQVLSQCDYPAGGSCASASRHTDYAYDALGRATGETVYSGSGTGTPKLSWTRGYATDGSLASTAFDGTASSQGSDTLTFTYDALGRPDQVKRGSTVLTDYGWNPTGTLASRIDGSLGSSAFSYDWANRLASMTSPAFSGSLLYTWRNDGLLAARQWPSGSGGAADFGYDAAKRPTGMTKYGTAAGSLAQTYDRDGNVTSESRSLTGVTGDAGSATQSFTYDGANRVILASGLTDSAAYLYDHDSNRVAAAIGASSSGYVYDRAGQLVSRVDGGSPTSFSYDRYGNQTGAAVAFNAVTTSTYDLADRLTSITPPGQGATSFSLDALGRHASRTTPSDTDPNALEALTHSVPPNSKTTPPSAQPG